MSFSTILPSQWGETRSALEMAASIAGVRRKEVLTILPQIPEDEAALRIDFDTQSFTANASGQEADAKTWRGFLNEKLRGPIPGAAWGNKSMENMVIPAGVCLILGAGGTGKTPLAHALAGHNVDSYGVVRVGEPLSGYTGDFRVAAQGLAQAMLVHSDVVLDSIKDLLSSGSGGAMKTGLSRGALTSLSTWSSIACDMGCTIYVPVNASTDDEEVMALLGEISRSNATTTITYDAKTSNSSSIWTYHARRGEGLNRVSGKLTLSFSNSAPKAVAQGKTIEMSEDEVAAEVARKLDVKTRVNVNDWNNAVRRSITMNGENNG